MTQSGFGTAGVMGDRRFRRAARALTWVLVCALAAWAIAARVLPAALGAETRTVLTGSMQPVIAPGDLVVITPITPAEREALAPGQIVVFLPDGEEVQVIHRIEAVQGDTVITRGDDNGASDAPIARDEVLAVYRYTVPGGRILTGLKERPEFLMIAGGLLVGWSLAGTRPKRRDAQTASAPDGDPAPETPARVDAEQAGEAAAPQEPALGERA